MADITGLSGLGSLSFNTITSAIDSAAKSNDLEGGSFKDILTDAIANSEGLDDKVNLDTLNLLAGEDDNLSDILIASEKSELAVNLTVQIRNKALAAYKEIMNMQV